MGFNLGNFLFGGAATPPKYNAPQLNQGTQDAIADVNGQSQISHEDTQKQLMEGVADSGKGLLQSPGQGANGLGEQESALGMTSSDSQKQAITDRGNRTYQAGLSNQTRQANLSAHQMQMERLKQAQGVLGEYDRFNLNVANSRIKNLLDENTARQQVMGDIAGLAGAGIGAYFGGVAGSRTGASFASKGMGGGKNYMSQDKTPKPSLDNTSIVEEGAE